VITSDVATPTPGSTHLLDQVVAAPDELADAYGEFIELVIGSDGDRTPRRSLFVGVADECSMIVGDALGNLERPHPLGLGAERARCARGERGDGDLLGGLRQGADGVGGVGADRLQVDEVVGLGDLRGFAGARREGGQHGDDDSGGAHVVEG